MALKYVQSNTLYLAGSGVIIGDTSVVLTTFSDIYGNVLTMADFGSKGYITLEPDTTNEESATFTNVVANANGTYTLTGVSTILAKSPYTETSGLVRAHAGGTKIVITDNVAFWNTFTNKNNNEVIAGAWTIANPSTQLGIANKAYVDSVVGGVTTTPQVITVGTAGATVAAGNVVYLDTATGRWKLCDAGTATTIQNVLMGVAQGAGTNGVAISGGVLLSGIDSSQSALVAGTFYYVASSGAISSAVGATERGVGIANSATTLYFNPDFFYIPKATQKAALLGFGGTPSTTNKYLLQAPTAQTYTPGVAGTATLDLSLGGYHFITMPAGNITVALSNDTNNQIFQVAVTQDAVGSRTVTWFATIKWIGGVTPTLTTTASKRDVFVFQRTGSGTYDGFIVGQNI